MSAPSLAVRLDGLRTRLEPVGQWARGGPVRALITKLVLTVGGIAVFLCGCVMLVLPGPGLVVMVAGLGLLAAEWEWARRLVHAVGTRVTRIRQALVPEGCSARRKAAAGVLAGGFMVLGFLATTAVTALVGATTIL